MELCRNTYDDVYTAISYNDYRFLRSTESYASFLVFYALHLIEMGYSTDAMRLLEESDTRFDKLNQNRVRDKNTWITEKTYLGLLYGKQFLECKMTEYLDKMKKLASELFSIIRNNPKLSNEHATNLKRARFIRLFANVAHKSYISFDARNDFRQISSVVPINFGSLVDYVRKQLW